MDRRAFLTRLFGAVATVATVPLAKVAEAFAPSGPHVVTFGDLGNDYLLHQREIADRYIKPAVQALADRIDSDILRHYQELFVQGSEEPIGLVDTRQFDRVHAIDCDMDEDCMCQAEEP